jgi:hypothetical protein
MGYPSKKLGPDLSHLTPFGTRKKLFPIFNYFKSAALMFLTLAIELAVTIAISKNVNEE